MGRQLDAERFDGNPPWHMANEIRTLTTHPIYVDWLPLPGPGAVGVTIAPGKCGVSLSGARWKRNLQADLERLVAVEHASMLVCLLEDREHTSLEIPELIAEAGGHGLHVLRLPLVDGSVPRSKSDVLGLLEEITSPSPTRSAS